MTSDIATSKRGLVLALLMTTAVALAAQAPPRFRYERTVQPAGTGPNRLAFDVPALAGLRPFASMTVMSPNRTAATGGASDLRLFDASGREVPYLLVDPPAGQARWIDAEILPIAATKETSGFEAALPDAADIDSLRVDGIPAPFLKRAVVEGSGDRERWTMLVPEATLFDLPNEQLQRLEVSFRPGQYRYVRVTWNDTNSGRVPTPSRARARHIGEAVTPGPALTAAIAFERRPSEPQRSRFRLQLPGAQLPIVRLQFDVDGPYVMRHASLFEAHFDGRQLLPVPIGSGVLKRVTRDGVQADELVVSVARAPREAQLELTIQDGNNPPLAIKSITAVFAELPAIYFESDGSPLTARYGDPRLQAPVYDLEAARAAIKVEAAQMAQWGPPSAAVTTEPAGEAPVAQTGPTLDPGLFKHTRDIAAGAAGLIAVPLDAAALAHSDGLRRSFADVRVVDASGRQVPYLVERLEEPLTMDLTLQGDPQLPPGFERGDKTSWYRIDLPYGGLPDGRLTLETSARVFRRRVSLLRPAPAEAVARRTARAIALGTDDWVHASQDDAAPPLVLNVPASPERALFVKIEEGDNAPLPLTHTSLLLPSYRIRLYRPSGTALRLLYGRDDLSPPQYDLALLTPQVLGASAVEAAAAAEPVRAEGDDAPQDVLVPPALFWTALALAIVVLLGIIARLMRPDGKPAAPQPPASDPAQAS